MTAISKTKVFTFCEMSENVSFFECTDKKLAKSFNPYNAKKFSHKYRYGVYKKPELYADSTLVEVCPKKVPK
jgi:hypothetical protein